MPAAQRIDSPRDRQLLIQLGGRLRAARLEQSLTATELAARAGISRMTLAAVEAGEATPTMGTYVRVMSALGMAGDIALLASGELRPSVASQAATKVSVGAGDARHDAQDLQSLMLHEEAIKLLKRNPELIQTALATLDRWRSKGGVSSRALWDEWSVILHRRDWRRAVARTRRSRELRQASPLPVLLPPEVRHAVLKQVGELRDGITLGQLDTGKKPRRTGSK